MLRALKGAWKELITPVKDPTIVKLHWPGVDRVFVLRILDEDKKASLKKTAQHLDKEHCDEYMILNFTDEADLGMVFKTGNVITYGLRYSEDMLFLIDICWTLDNWLKARGIRRVIIVTQQRGYDPSPLISSCYMIFKDSTFDDGQRALDTVRSLGVHVQPQYEEGFKRYVRDFAKLFSPEEGIACEQRIWLVGLQVANCPPWSRDSYDLEIYSRDSSSGEWVCLFSVNDSEASLSSGLDLRLSLLGDIWILYTVPIQDRKTGRVKREPLFRFSFNTLFLPLPPSAMSDIPKKIKVTKNILDFASNKPCHIVPDDFHIVLEFQNDPSLLSELSSSQKDEDLLFLSKIAHSRVHNARECYEEEEEDYYFDNEGSESSGSDYSSQDSVGSEDENDYYHTIRRQSHVEFTSLVAELKVKLGEVVDATFLSVCDEVETERKLRRKSLNRSCTPTEAEVSIKVTNTSFSAKKGRTIPTLNVIKPTMTDKDMEKIFEGGSGGSATHRHLHKSFGMPTPRSPANLPPGTPGYGSAFGKSSPPGVPQAPKLGSPGASPPKPPKPPAPPGKGSGAPPPPPKTGGPPPPPPPPGGKGVPPPPPPGGKGGVPPPPPPPPTLSKKGPSMKTFHWKKVKPVSEDSVWSSLQRDGTAEESVDLDLLTKMFEKKKIERKPVKKEEGKLKKSTAIPGARAQNIGIVLSFLKLNAANIKEAVLMCNDEILRRDALEGLLSIVPQEDEVSGLNREKETSPDIIWGPPEEYCWLIGNKIPDLEQRVKLWIFTHDFEKQVEELTGEMVIYEKSINTLLDSDSNFAKILALVLTVGNKMNQGTMHGGATGFSMENLSNLSSIKSNDGSASLMDFVVMSVLKNAPQLQQFADELRPVAAARVIAIADIARGVQQLKSGINLIRKRLKSPSDEEDTFPDKLQSFLAKSEDPLDVIVETCNRLTTKTTELATFYGESAIGFDPGVFFTQIINFKQEFEVGVKQHKEKELRQKKAKEREIAKNKKEGKKITDDNKTKPTVDLKDFTKPFNISNGAAKREKTETETTESVVDSQIHVDAIPTTESNQPGDN